MLNIELRGERLNKAEHNRQLQKLLPMRSRSAIEFKHENISAVLIELGYPSIDGYKPLPNYQELLREVVATRLGREQSLEDFVRESVMRPPDRAPAPKDLLSILVPTPRTEAKKPSSVVQETPQTGKFASRDYLELESRNRSLGLAGEELVLQFEHERLWRAGARHLADRIEHVAAKGQDNLGFDILSFENDGRERLIEVKTTRYGAYTPFFASRNEVEVSEECSANYHLYRLHKFSREPKLFMLSGSLRSMCRLETSSYLANVA
jgi:hypothetical protein